MKICIATYYTEDFKDLYNLISPSYKSYCKKYNYDYYSEDITNTFNERHPVWFKIKLLINLLEKYDAVLSVDCDTLLTNDSIKIENFIKPDKDLYLSKDINGANTGVLLIKNSEWSKSILNSCWNIEKNHPIYSYPFAWDKTQGEQRAIIAMIEKFGESYVEWVSQKIFNAYYYNLYQMNYPDGEWSSESFILHAPGCSTQQRMDLFKSKLNKNE